MFRLEVIEYYDPTGQSVVARVPESGSAAIKFGAQLIVQQSQTAVFFRDGRAMDQFGPGRHTLTTANIPILSQILTLPFEKSPFQAAVYFVGRQTFLDQRWGTRQPITLRDKDFGIVRLRGFGKFSYRVSDPALLLNTVVGSQGRLSTEQIVDYLRDQIVASLTDVFASASVPLLDMPGRIDELGVAARLQTAQRFEKLGLELVEILISSITPPEEVQKAIDARSSMAVLGDLNSFMTYQAARGIEAAGRGGDTAGGMGIGFGMMLPAMVQQAIAAAAPQRGAAPAAAQTPQATAEQPRHVDPAAPLAALRKIAAESDWKIEHDADDQMILNIPLGPMRRQRVRIESGIEDGQGNRILGIWSICGPINPSSAALLLRSNDTLVHGGLALRQVDGTEQLVVRNNLMLDTIDVAELSRSVAAVAWQADQIEAQLSGEVDTH